MQEIYILEKIKTYLTAVLLVLVMLGGSFPTFLNYSSSAVQKNKISGSQVGRLSRQIRYCKELHILFLYLFQVAFDVYIATFRVGVPIVGAIFIILVRCFSKKVNGVVFHNCVFA